jgi:hypothetical protein
MLIEAGAMKVDVAVARLADGAPGRIKQPALVELVGYS